MSKPANEWFLEGQVTISILWSECMGDGQGLSNWPVSKEPKSEIGRFLAALFSAAKS